MARNHRFCPDKMSAGFMKSTYLFRTNLLEIPLFFNGVDIIG